LIRDARLLIEARKEALAWLEKDPQLKSKESAGMRARDSQTSLGQTLAVGSGGVETLGRGGFAGSRSPVGRVSEA